MSTRNTNLDDLLLSHVGSGVRMSAVLVRRPNAGSLDWFRLLGANWSICDDIGHHTDALRRLLKSANPAHIDAMMTDDERTIRAALPATFIAYRGCYVANRLGLSYSLSRDVAAEFPYLNRYRQLGQALLVTARIQRAQAIVKLDRGEREIIAPVRRIIATDDLLRPTKKKRFVVLRTVGERELPWNCYFDMADADYEVRTLRAQGYVARVHDESDSSAPR